LKGNECAGEGEGMEGEYMSSETCIAAPVDFEGGKGVLTCKDGVSLEEIERCDVVGRVEFE